MQRQYRDGGGKADALRARRDIGEHEVRAGEHAERVEMMLADPGRMHAERVGIDRLIGCPALFIDLHEPPLVDLHASLLESEAFAVRPESRRQLRVVDARRLGLLGRIADTLSDPALLPYKFLIVGHAAATGKREYNLTLSQRRADAVRDVLVNTFKISPKRLQAIGLGEEQLLDAAHPAAADNQRIQIATVGKLL